MARKYSKGAQRKVKKVMEELKRGTLKSGHGVVGRHGAGARLQ